MRGDRSEAPNPNPKAWDVSGYVPTAAARAKELFSDAVLVRIDAEGVYPSGKADLTLDDSFYVLYRFLSPSRAVRPKDLPKGVDFVARLKADNPVVVTVQVPREIVVEEPTAEAAAAPTTEIISEKPEAAAAAGAPAAGAAAAADKEKKEPAK